MHFIGHFHNCNTMHGFLNVNCLGVAELFHAGRRTADGQIDRHDEATSRFLQFCRRAKKILNIIYDAGSITCIYRNTATLYY